MNQGFDGAVSAAMPKAYRLTASRVSLPQITVGPDTYRVEIASQDWVKKA
ncbi:hypothetical protein [Laspinema olomoucense]|uniref:Uncharacterized protein n=1 Tax=Laspinema olomoucense D3b TaxID=2953688 RepID=A0ABT2N7B9_9CYAN|nr:MULTISPECIES: hypothetical protein [unclassified Laspinema]MCT7974073.1 hypothetical protein [Laspinema sp. D3d]MCT7978482.1 hypothetical protein [Laspinema sp. D3b]